MGSFDVLRSSTIRVEKGKWTKTIPVAMLEGHEDKIQAYFNCTINELILRSVKVKEFVECFRAHNYNHLMIKEMDVLVHCWIHCWTKNGHFS
jgi:hypothetical protein